MRAYGYDLGGGTTVTAVVEIPQAGKEIQTRTLQGATPELVKQYPDLQPHYADDNGNLKAVVQAFLVKTPERAIVVDTCVGDGRNVLFPEWSNLQSGFLELLAASGVKREDVDTVLCTHMHFDHIGWNTMKVGDKWVPTFPRAEYIFSKTEHDHWRNRPEIKLDFWRQVIPGFQGEHDLLNYSRSVEPILGAARFVDMDAQISQGVRLIPTPGHTPGHVSVEVRSGQQRAIITGDMIHHLLQTKHLDMSAGEAGDELVQATETRKKAFADWADNKTLILGSHFAFPCAVRMWTTDNEKALYSFRPVAPDKLIRADGPVPGSK